VTPSISEMSNITQTEDTRLVLKCSTRGDPMPTLTLRKDNQPPFNRGDNVSLHFVYNEMWPVLHALHLATIMCCVRLLSCVDIAVRQKLLIAGKSLCDV